MHPGFTRRGRQNRLWRMKLKLLLVGLPLFAIATAMKGEETHLGLQTLVQPSTLFLRDGQAVKFSLHGFVTFFNLEELFAYIDRQAGRWKFSTAREREAFASDLLRRGIQSRLVSMYYEKPMEILTTHTSQELSAAVSDVRTAAAPLIFKGLHWQLTSDMYRSVLLRLQEHWKSSLNCWSASPSIPARVLSNWYIIDEGITLFGARYDSTEHFWQAVKYHPEIRPGDLLELLNALDQVSWAQWLDRLSDNQRIYLQHTYAIEFLRANLAPARREWFRREVSQIAPQTNMPVRQLQQRGTSIPGRVRFSALEEKTLWGDLADLFHLIYFFAGAESDVGHPDFLKSMFDALRKNHFDAIYLEGYRTGKVNFISREFQQLMLEIWKVKYLEIKRFGEVIRSTKGMYLDHFLNDGDSPDIPIPVYVGFLNQIREMALHQKR